jgi:hypothetical protein
MRYDRARVSLASLASPGTRHTLWRPTWPALHAGQTSPAYADSSPDVARTGEASICADIDGGATDPMGRYAVMSHPCAYSRSPQEMAGAAEGCLMAEVCVTDVTAGDCCTKPSGKGLRLGRCG